MDLSASAFSLIETQPLLTTYLCDPVTYTLLSGGSAVSQFFLPFPPDATDYFKWVPLADLEGHPFYPQLYKAYSKIRKPPREEVTQATFP